MPDSTKPATGALIMEQAVQIESTVAEILQMLQTHTGAAVTRQATLEKQIGDLTKDTHYYGDQLIKVYHDLNKNLRRLSEQLDRVLVDEEDRAA
jgi:septal ring factor EnvC (AmiA/AmiB activator)